MLYKDKFGMKKAYTRDIRDQLEDYSESSKKTKRING